MHEEDFLRFMSVHLVPLVYECECLHEGTWVRRWGYASGFVIAFFGRWFWATAGIA